MKVRHGFVSNSSSSSFVLVTTKKHFDDVMSRANEWLKEDEFRNVLGDVIKTMGGTRKFAGQEIVVFSTYCDNGGGGTLENVSGEVYEAWEALSEELQKNKEECFTKHTSF
jgi:hypothetical protein